MELHCWRCGVAIAVTLLPLRREEVCETCNADLHVCKLCIYYNPSVSDACDEPIALDVSNKERANFCDYFKPSPRAYKGREAATARARADLDALFGGAAAADMTVDNQRAELERLFGIKNE